MLTHHRPTADKEGYDMKTTLAAASALVLIFAVGCTAGTVPSVTTQINVANGVKEYLYTFTNDLDSGGLLYGVVVYMPKAGYDAVTGFSVSRTDWYAGHWHKDDVRWWCHATALSGGSLTTGQSVTLRVTTAAGVPTTWGFAPPGYPFNWDWSNPGAGPLFGDSSLPVPVPEPRGLIGLVSGLGALAAPLIRRRRR